MADENTIQEYERLKIENGKLKSELSELNNQLNSLQKLHAKSMDTKLSANSSKKKAEDAIYNENEKLTKKVVELEKSLSDAAARIAANETESKKMETQRDSALKQVMTLLAENKTLQRDIETARTELKNLQIQHQQIEELRNQLQNERDLLQKAKDPTEYRKILEEQTAMRELSSKNEIEEFKKMVRESNKRLEESNKRLEQQTEESNKRLEESNKRNEQILQGIQSKFDQLTLDLKGYSESLGLRAGYDALDLFYLDLSGAQGYSHFYDILNVYRTAKDSQAHGLISKVASQVGLPVDLILSMDDLIKKEQFRHSEVAHPNQSKVDWKKFWAELQKLISQADTTPGNSKHPKPNYLSNLKKFDEKIQAFTPDVNKLTKS